jgi:hypothetical protein
MDKAGITEVVMVDDRSGSGVWYCNLKNESQPGFGISGEGSNAIKALLDALIRLKRRLDTQSTF